MKHQFSTPSSEDELSDLKRQLKEDAVKKKQRRMKRRIQHRKEVIKMTDATDTPTPAAAPAQPEKKFTVRLSSKARQHADVQVTAVSARKARAAALEQAEDGNVTWQYEQDGTVVAGEVTEQA